MEFEYTKKGQRQVSAFFVKEMLYEYSKGRLDPERDQSIKRFIEFSMDAQVDLGKIQRADFYIKKLGAVTFKPSLISEIKQLSSLRTRMRSHLNIESWSKTFKWSVEGVLVAGLMSLLLNYIPWSPLINEKIWSSHKDIILAEIKNTKHSQEFKEPEDLPVCSDTNPTPTPPKPLKKETPAAVVTQPQQAASETPTATASEGEIYRASFTVSNLTPESAALAKAIIDMGGRKAGSVDLGGLRNNKTSYFHFTIPTAKMALLETELLKYGHVQLKKERHSRVMPEGITRIIIEINQNPKIEKIPK